MQIFLGIKSYETIDLSAASVELFWDLSQCNCIFSRITKRLDEKLIETSQCKIKYKLKEEKWRFCCIDEDGVITYFSIDKYTIMKLKHQI